MDEYYYRLLWGETIVADKMLLGTLTLLLNALFEHSGGQEVSYTVEKIKKPKGRSNDG